MTIGEVCLSNERVVVLTGQDAQDIAAEIEQTFRTPTFGTRELKEIRAIRNIHGGRDWEYKYV